MNGKNIVNLKKTHLNIDFMFWKKIIVPFVILLLQIQAATAQDTLNQKVNGAYITLEEQMKDAGDIYKDETLDAIFKFTNTGDQDLIIKNVITTCSCTSREYTEGPIAPGKSGEIKVHFDSSKQDKIGRQNKVITIISNAQNNPERVIWNFNILEKKNH